MLHMSQNVFFIATAFVPIKVGRLGYCMIIFWRKGAQCTQHSGGFPLGEPKWGHSFPTMSVVGR